MTKQLLISFIALLAPALATAQDGYVQKILVYSQTPFTVDEWTFQNPYTYSTLASKSGSDTNEGTITGSTISGPPTWDSRFDPLGTYDPEVLWGVNQMVPEYYQLDMYVDYNVGNGTQQFDLWSGGVDTGTSISRSANNMYTYVDSRIVTKQYIFNDGEGGGAG